MQLISPLASGIVGAGGGTVTIKNRGTATYATVYSDWDGRDTISTGAPLSLDANGGLVAYVQAPVDVVVRSDIGATVRSWTESISADSVEYRGPSFTGIDQVTLASGRGSAYPVSLDTILDLWNSSSAAYDFQIDVDGTDVALSAIPTPDYFYNVVDYGATGDGTTDDLVAVNAAIAAANTAGGGVVWFPAGTYRVTSQITWYRGVSLWGGGTAQTEIQVDSANKYTLRATTTSGTQSKIYGVRGIRFTSNVATFGHVDFLTAGMSNDDIVTFDSCVFDGTNTTYIAALTSQSGYYSTFVFRNSVFYVGSNAAIRNTASVAPIIHIDRCGFELATAGARGAYPVISIVSGSVSNCRIDVSGSTSAFNIIQAYVTSTRPINLDISGNIFYGGDSSQYAIALSDMDSSDSVVESRNTFSVCAPYYYVCTSTEIPQTVDLGSRRGKTLYQDITASTFDIDPDLAETYMLSLQYAGDVTLSLTKLMPPGSRLNIIVNNDSSTPATRTVMYSAYFYGAANAVIPDGDSASWMGVAVRYVNSASDCEAFETLAQHP